MSLILGAAARAGWQPYGQWAQTHAGSDDSYLVDDALRIKTSSAGNGDGVTALTRPERIRDLLGQRGKVARLVGLSGVGKNRFVQALFDPAIGAYSLDPSLAVYADMADAPDPQPIVLAIGWWFTRKGAEHGAAKVPVPVFALAFLALCAANSVLPNIPGLAEVYAPVRSAFIVASTWGLLISIAALGSARHWPPSCASAGGILRRSSERRRSFLSWSQLAF